MPKKKTPKSVLFKAMDQWIAVLLRRWRNGILPSIWKAESTKKLESSGAALTQSVELMLDVQERFATVPNGPVADRVTAKLKAVLDKNPGFYVLKQVSNVLSGTDSKIPGSWTAEWAKTMRLIRALMTAFDGEPWLSKA
ncbi:hypothetical protein HPB50_023831 [Hyalomma asiaticum]|uniref:Uncharacterized protein n=1 Tax=Hyalomma asiaticum TaxID=266040 RepID=A0ACB7SQJ5_HYAAI|nr:hypothetical protein HPB50_023831 [Hyalomma asiaticum]